MNDLDDKGPDLSHGVALSAFPENGLLTGHVGGDAVLLVRQGEEIFAIPALHPLSWSAGGMVGGAIRCP